ncbi:MAG: EAL domain-containing protein [Pseudomonadota bacterium]
MNRLTNFLGGLSLRRRLLVAPLLGLVLFIALTAAFIYGSMRQNALLQQVSEQDFAAYDQYAQTIGNLSEQHAALYDLLQETMKIDEEVLYDRAKARLNKIHLAVNDLEKAAGSPVPGENQDEAALRNAFLASTRAYREAASSAVAMATVNIALAPRHIMMANKHFTTMIHAYRKLLDSGRENIRNQISSGVRQGQATAAVITIAGAVGAVLLLGLSIILSRFLSRSLEAQIATLTDLGLQAGTSFSVHGNDEVERIANATVLFKQSLLQLRDKEQALAELNKALMLTMDDLQRARNELEYRVQERTQELQEANDGFRVEIELRKVAERHVNIYAEIIRSTGEAVVITDLRGKIIEVNPAYEKSVGRAHGDLIGTSVYENNSADSEEFRRQLWQSLDADGHWTGEILTRRHDGESFSSWVLINAVRDENGNPGHYVWVSRDMTELKKSEEQLKRLAFYDSMTGLPNRALFKDRLAGALIIAQRQETLVGVIYLDLDRFKVINDSLGHPVGDALLQAVAAKLKGALRKSDTVARLGGDEFVIMMPTIARPEDAATVAKTLLAALSRPLQVEGNEFHVTASLGISVYPQDGDTHDILLKNADAAMYRAKEQGNNNFQFYTRQLGEDAQARITLESALHRALEQREFELHYQPKVDLKTGQISGVEALIRWRHPERGMVPPDQFIRLAEEIGLIVPIGEWVLKTACEQAKAWHANGYSNISMAVNLSARQFRQHDILGTVRRVLADTGLPPEYLELELTESVFMKDSDSVLEALRQLKALGVFLSLDDFGTGYSSLSYLRRFPIDVVKIDRSFTRDVTDSDDDASLTKAIIAMAKSLNMRTVAEGVETEGQLNFFLENRCDAIQGYFFSRPLPTDGMTALLREGKCLSVTFAHSS